MKERQQIPIINNSANVPSGIPVPFDLGVEMESGTSCNIRIETSPMTLYLDVIFTTAPELWSMRFTTPQDGFIVRDGTGTFKKVWVEYDVPDAHLITEEEISTLARPCYIDHAKALQFIAEAEQQDIKAKVGDGLFAWVTTFSNQSTPEGILMLQGGEWTDSHGNTHVLNGLKKALAYFTFSRIITGANIEMTRTGAINRTSEHSMRSDWQERLQVSRECFGIGQRYLDEVMCYVGGTPMLSAIAHPHRSDNQRTKIKIIGD